MTTCLTPSVIFIMQKVLGKEDPWNGGGDPWNLSLDTVSAKKIELMKKDNGVYKTAYRLTKIEAQPFVYPFTIDPIIMTGGGNLSAKSGYMRYSKSVNSGIHYFDLMQEFERELKALFGSALNNPEVQNDVSGILLDKLDDPNVRSEEISQLFSILIDNYTILPRRNIVTAQDETVIIRCLKEKKLNAFFWQFGNVIRQASEEQKVRIVEAVIDHIINNYSEINTNPKKGDQLKGLLSSLSWSANEIGPTQKQLEQINKSNGLKSFIHSYIRKKASETGDGRKKAMVLNFLAKWESTPLNESGP
jgi:hypothetical protein